MTASPYAIRNYLPSDFDSLVLFFREESPSSHFTPRRITDWLARPVFSPEQDIFVVHVNNLIVGYISIEPELEISRVILDCRLHPDHQRQGLSARLLQCALERARELSASVAHVEVMEDNHTAVRALEKHSFRPVRHYYELKLDMRRVDWDEAEKSSRFCRGLLPGEEADLADIQNRSFAGHWGYNPNTEKIIAFSVNRARSSPEDVILACEEDDIVGFCRTIISGRGEGRILMIGTDPDFRSRGVGRKSLLAGLLHLKSKNVRTVYLTVDTENDTAIALYDSVGFVRNNTMITYERTVG